MASANRNSSSGVSVGRARPTAVASRTARTGERTMRSASTAALKTARRTPTFVLTVLGATLVAITSITPRTCAGVMLESCRLPRSGRKCVRSTVVSRARVDGRFAGLLSSHCMTHSAKVTFPTRGSRQWPRSRSACARARKRVASPFDAKGHRGRSVPARTIRVPRLPTARWQLADPAELTSGRHGVLHEAHEAEEADPVARRSAMPGAIVGPPVGDDEG